jgi:hypothetical protein
LQHFETWIGAGHGAKDITGVVELITARATAESMAPRAH